MRIEIDIPDDLVQFYRRARVWDEGSADRPIEDKLAQLIEEWVEAMVAQCPGLKDPIRRKLHRQLGLSMEDDEFL